MKKIKLKTGIVALLFSLGCISYAQGEVGLYSLEINKKVKTRGTKVYIENEKMYMELQELLKVLEITNNRWVNEIFTIDENNIYGIEKQINLEKKYIRIGNEKLAFSNDMIYEKDEKIFVRTDMLSKLLGITEIERNDDRLILKMRTNFLLPVELNNIREYKKQEFEKGDNATRKDIGSQRKLLAPGNLRLVYNYGKTYQPNGHEYKYIDGEYLGPLLYGDLELYYGIYPKFENYQTRLKYTEVYKNHDIIFGDMSVNMPNTLRGTVDGIRGISFTKDYAISAEYDEDKITIKGQAPLGKFVELYKNGQLLSYEDVQNGQYIFENVSSIFGSDTFEVIIYNLDGSIKKEKLNRYSNTRLERKGEFGYNIQVGESSYEGYHQFIAEIDYGLLDNLTVSTGFYDLEYDAYFTSNNPQDLKSYKLGAFHVGTIRGENPYTLEVEFLKDTKGEQDYYLDFSQTYKNVVFTGEYGKYSDNTARRINKTNELYLTLSKSQVFFDSLTVGLKYYSTDYIYSGKDREIGASFRTRFRSFIPEYSISKNIEREIVYHDFNVRSYYFPDYIMYAGVYRREVRSYDETRYRFEISSRRHTQNGVRYSAYYEKSERYGDVYGVSFNVDYDTWFTGRLSHTKSNGRSSTTGGFTLDKVINLSDVNSRVTNVQNGNIQGKVYLDNNYNGKYDPEIDKPLPRTQVLARGIVGVTNEKGKYVIGNLYPERYDLTIETQNPLYRAQYDKYKVKVGQAAPVYLDIPVYPRKIASGMIYFENEDLRHRYVRTLYMNVIDITTGQKLEVVVPETDGYFSVENLTLGKYKLILESTESAGKILVEKELEVTPEMDEIFLDINISGNNEKELKYEFMMY